MSKRDELEQSSEPWARPSKLFGHESAFHTFSPNSEGAFRQFLLPLLLLTLVAKARIATEKSLAKPADFSIMFA